MERAAKQSGMISAHRYLSIKTKRQGYSKIRTFFQNIPKGGLGYPNPQRSLLAPSAVLGSPFPNLKATSVIIQPPAQLHRLTNHPSNHEPATASPLLPPLPSLSFSLSYPSPQILAPTFTEQPRARLAFRNAGLDSRGEMSG